MVVIELSRKLKDQASDTRVQLGFRDDRGQSSPTPIWGYLRFVRQPTGTENSALDGFMTHLGNFVNPAVSGRPRRTCFDYEASMNSRAESTDAREGKKLLIRQSWT
jgi:hypothetical protein